MFINSTAEIDLNFVSIIQIKLKKQKQHKMFSFHNYRQFSWIMDENSRFIAAGKAWSYYFHVENSSKMYFN